MRFWDTSAVVPLLVEQPASEQVAEVFGDDTRLCLWWGTRVEIESAIARLSREGALDARSVAALREALTELATASLEILPGSQLRETATRLLHRHPLRAADALQLAAAHVWCEDVPSGRSLVSLDHRLREAALREGFDVLPRRAA